LPPNTTAPRGGAGNPELVCGLGAEGRALEAEAAPPAELVADEATGGSARRSETTKTTAVTPAASAANAQRRRTYTPDTGLGGSSCCVAPIGY